MKLVIAQMQPPKNDNCRPENGHLSTRICINCDMYMTEDLKHMVMQSESTSHIRKGMYE